MILTFTKEDYWDYSPEDGIDLSFCRGYTIYQDEELFGHFFFNSRRSYAAFEDKRYLFEYKVYFFKRSEHLVTDLNTNERVAVTFTIPGIGSLLGKKDRLSFNNEVFQLYKEDADVKFRPFNRDWWRREKFSLRSDTNRITYQMHTKRPALYAARVTEGTIESTTDDFLIIAAGLYLQEHDHEVRRS